MQHIKTYGDPSLSTFSSGTNFPAFFEYFEMLMKDDTNFPKMGMPIVDSNPPKCLLYFVGNPNSGQKKSLAFRTSDQNLHRIVVYENYPFPFQLTNSLAAGLLHLYTSATGTPPAILRNTTAAVGRGAKVQFQTGPSGSTYTNAEVVGSLASMTPGSEAGIARVNVMGPNKLVKMAWEADQKQKYHSWAISDAQKMRLTETGLDLTLNYGYSFPTDITSESPSLPLTQGKQFYRFDLRQSFTYSGDFGWHNSSGYFQPAGAVIFVDANKGLNASNVHFDPVNKYMGVGTTSPEFALTVDAQWPNISVVGIRRAASGSAVNFLVLKNMTSAVGSGAVLSIQSLLDNGASAQAGGLSSDLRTITAGTEDGRTQILTRGQGSTRASIEIDNSPTVNAFNVQDRYDSNFMKIIETGLGLGGVTPKTQLDIGTGAIATRATSPAQISSNQNNYDIGTSGWLRISTDASRNITGLKGGQDGRELTITNVGSNDLVLSNLDGLSSVENQFRFSTGASITLLADASLKLKFDNTSKKWRDIS